MQKVRHPESTVKRLLLWLIPSPREPLRDFQVMMSTLYHPHAQTQTNFRFESKVMRSISKHILHQSCLYTILTVMWQSGYCAVENVAATQDSVSGKYDNLFLRNLNSSLLKEAAVWKTEKGKGTSIYSAAMRQRGVISMAQASDTAPSICTSAFPLMSF